MLTLSPKRPPLSLKVLAGVALIAALAAPLMLSPFELRIGHSIFMGAGMALSWYILGGFTGYYSFGHTAFVGIGAFGAAIFQRSVDLGHWVPQLLASLAAGVLACAALAAVIAWPILRLRGHYFTIAMLAVSLVAAEVVNSFGFFGGSIGVALRPVEPAWIRPELFFYYVLLAGVVLVVSVVHLLRSSRLGYGLMSIRENEDAAEMLGVATARQKSVCFVLSGALCGLFGAILAFNLGYITTDSVFRGQISLEMIVFCLLGGMSSIAGPIIGAVVMTILTKVLLGDFLEVHLALTGIVIIAVVFLAPNGVVGGIRWIAARAGGTGERAREAGDDQGATR